LAELDLLERPDHQAAVVVETFFGVTSLPVSIERVESVSEAITDADAAALYRIGYGYAPFHCPDCARLTVARTGTGEVSRTTRTAASKAIARAGTSVCSPIERGRPGETGSHTGEYSARNRSPAGRTPLAPANHH